MSKLLLGLALVACAHGFGYFPEGATKTPLEAYEICKVESCDDAITADGSCCTGGGCDSESGVCYTDDGCPYVYSDEYYHTGRRLREGRKLFDRCDDDHFCECMARETGVSMDDVPDEEDGGASMR